MNIKKQPFAVRLLLSVGILFTTFPLLFKDYVAMPDFARGALEGIGIGLELVALIRIKRSSQCNNKLPDTV